MSLSGCTNHCHNSGMNSTSSSPRQSSSPSADRSSNAANSVPALSQQPSLLTAHTESHENGTPSSPERPTISPITSNDESMTLNSQHGSDNKTQDENPFLDQYVSYNSAYSAASKRPHTRIVVDKRSFGFPARAGFFRDLVVERIVLQMLRGLAKFNTQVVANDALVQQFTAKLTSLHSDTAMWQWAATEGYNVGVLGLMFTQAMMIPFADFTEEEIKEIEEGIEKFSGDKFKLTVDEKLPLKQTAFDQLSRAQSLGTKSFNLCGQAQCTNHCHRNLIL